jgi:hypothetical protein
VNDCRTAAPSAAARHVRPHPTMPRTTQFLAVNSRASLDTMPISDVATGSKGPAREKTQPQRLARASCSDNGPAVVRSGTLETTAPSILSTRGRVRTQTVLGEFEPRLK